MKNTDLTTCCLGHEVCLHGPSPFTERGGRKRGLHSNCWGEVWRIAAHIAAFLRLHTPISHRGRGEYAASKLNLLTQISCA